MEPMSLFWCGVVGLGVTAAIVMVTEYYTGTGFRPVKSVANAKEYAMERLGIKIALLVIALAGAVYWAQPPHLTGGPILAVSSGLWTLVILASFGWERSEDWAYRLGSFLGVTMATVEGVSVMQLRDGLIATYHEIANTAPAFVDLNFAPERIAKIVGRQGAALKARDEMKMHLK